jgi:hypothetical protein
MDTFEGKEPGVREAVFYVGFVLLAILAVLLFHLKGYSAAPVEASSLSKTDLMPDAISGAVDQRTGYLPATGIGSEQFVVQRFSVELINPDLGYRHDVSGTRIVRTITHIPVKPIHLELGYRHDASGTRIVPSPARINVQSINEEYGFKHDERGTRIIPPLTSLTIEPVGFEYRYRLVTDGNGAKIGERDILVKGILIR